MALRHEQHSTSSNETESYFDGEEPNDFEGTKTLRFTFSQNP